MQTDWITYKALLHFRESLLAILGDETSREIDTAIARHDLMQANAAITDIECNKLQVAA